PPPPFRLHLSTFQPSLTQLCNHTWPRDVHLVGDFSAPSRFFLAVAVGGFLLALGGLGGYLGFGFLNLVLWAGGSWFIYKETPFHRPAPPPTQGHTPSAI
ncbi:synaptophysin-like protein 1, partial [Empidonax traillii]|uniref:synaptophysin-like protein 1 n=1 Tax=Empidonax traillii TaxID=164674 RepID=UPI000FFD4387